MTPEFVLAFGAIFQFILPEFFSFRYAKNLIWNAILKSAAGDSHTISDFFQSIEKGKFGDYPQREVMLTYMDFGLDVLSTYVSSFLTGAASLALLIAYKNAWLITLLSLALIALSVITVFEFSRRLSDRKINAYSMTGRRKIKFILILLNIVVIVTPLISQLGA